MLQLPSQQANMKHNRLRVTVGVISESAHTSEYTFSDETLLTYFLEAFTESGTNTEIAMYVVAEVLILSDLKHLAGESLNSLNPIEYERATLVRQLLTDNSVTKGDDTSTRTSLGHMMSRVD